MSAQPPSRARDSAVVCAGQEPVRDLEIQSRSNGIDPHIIGDAALAAELDARRAIKQGTEVGGQVVAPFH